MDDNDDNDVDSNESSSSSSRNGDDRTNNVNVGHRQNQLTLRSFVIEIARNLHCSRNRASSERSDPHTWSKMPPMDAQARMHEIMVSRNSVYVFMRGATTILLEGTQTPVVISTKCPTSPRRYVEIPFTRYCFEKYTLAVPLIRHIV